MAPSDVDVKVKSAYKEDENFVPNATDVRAYVDTTGTGGAAAADVRNSSHIFDLHDQEVLNTAAAALDPDDDTDEGLVTLPGESDAKEERKTARDRIQQKAKKGKKTVEVGGPTPAQEAAAEENKDVQKGSGSSGSGSSAKSTQQRSQKSTASRKSTRKRTVKKTNKSKP